MCHEQIRYRLWGGFVRLVVKFGGTSLGSGQRIDRAADSIEKAVSDGHEVAVVASAMGSTTDELLDEIHFDATAADRAEIVSMGERTSVRMLSAALRARGVEARFLEPGLEDWPIITDEHGEVQVGTTKERAQALADSLSDGVPVITGFLAQSEEGGITTLGRGGSDTTAMMLGNYMAADEVIIVTDVEGVMTGDPRVVEGARNVGEISVDELRNLTFRGAEVVAPSALSYKTNRMNVRVIHYQHGDLLTGGTRIEGQFRNLIDLREQPLACLTVAGRAIRNQRGVLAKLTSELAEHDINIDGVSSGMDSISFYVDSSDAQRAETVLHGTVVSDEVLSSITLEESIAAVRVTGAELPTQLGVLSAIVLPLGDAHIQIHDLITSATSISIFINWEDGERTLEIVQSVFED